jgi:hypothetical protein
MRKALAIVQARLDESEARAAPGYRASSVSHLWRTHARSSAWQHAGNDRYALYAGGRRTGDSESSLVSFCKAKYHFRDSHCAHTECLASAPLPVTGIKIHPRDQHRIATPSQK